MRPLLGGGETEGIGATTGSPMGWVGLLLLALALWGSPTRCPNGRPIPPRLLKATSSFLLAKQEQTKRQNREPNLTYARQPSLLPACWYSPSFGVGLAPLFEPGWRVLRIANPKGEVTKADAPPVRSLGSCLLTY
jgi:hypothetical protein